jgi:hypothetical protein
MGKSEYKIIWKEGSFFEKGHWRIVRKDSDGGGAIVAIIVIILLVIFIGSVFLMSLPVWGALLGFQMIREKRFIAGIIAFVGLIYFHIDMSNGWISSLLFHGWTDNEGEFTSGLLGFSSYRYFLIADYLGAGLGLGFIADAILITQYGKKFDDGRVTLPQVGIYIIPMVLNIIIASLISLHQLNGKVNIIENEEIINKENKILSNKEETDQNEKITDADWQIEKSIKVKFSNNNQYLIEMSSQKGDEYELKFKLSIKIIEDEKNNLIWESDYKEGYIFESLEILKTNKTAIIAGIYNLGGAHALNNYFVVRMDELGTISPENIVEQYGYIEKTINNLSIVEENQKILYEIKDNEIIRSIVTKDNMTPVNSIKAYFKVENNKVVAMNNVVKIKIGETVAFLPIDDFSTELFNSGKIFIYSDAWNNDFSICEANRIKSGNFYTFDSAGEFHFLLCSDCNVDIISPTFTIYVAN